MMLTKFTERIGKLDRARNFFMEIGYRANEGYALFFFSKQDTPYLTEKKVCFFPDCLLLVLHFNQRN